MAEDDSVGISLGGVGRVEANSDSYEVREHSSNTIMIVTQEH